MPARGEGKPPPADAEAPPAVEEEPVRVTPGLSAAEEIRLGELQAKIAAASGGGPTVRLKVEAPHSAVTFGGRTVGTDFTDVPVSVAADLVAGAAEAGVTVTQDQES